MEGLRVSENLTEIRSYRFNYSFEFADDPFSIINSATENDRVIIDRNVLNLYRSKLKLTEGKYLAIDAFEDNKSLEKVVDYLRWLVDSSMKRNGRLFVIGGGITQDISCFMATNFYRGIEWWFFPTTLLAQSDSCIGSKSSINFMNVKNLIGSFYPPKKVIVSTEFLNTLKPSEIHSGIGEMLKVHIVKSTDAYKKVSQAYDQLIQDRKILKQFIYESLMIKKEIIEIDEFDDGYRNIMNYGHSFGHALESATNFGVPHGIAVTIGMDVANFYSYRTGRISKELYELYHPALKKNYVSYAKDLKFSLADFEAALSKDKKNVSQKYALILPKSEGSVEKVLVDKSEAFTAFIKEFFSMIN